MSQSPYHLGFCTLDRETSLDDLPVRGTVPTWLTGTLKTDFLIPPFALFYFYTVFAAALNLPLVSTQEFSLAVLWVGLLVLFPSESCPHRWRHGGTSQAGSAHRT
jgi:hypothetical protein